MLEKLVASPLHLEIVLILTIGSVLATIFGYLTERLRLSPILGYLLAGYFIGPYSPGFIADAELCEQLAEIGVILMMFWVGLHIKWRELVHVKNIAITGALGQTLFSTIVGIIVVRALGWSLESALVIGLSVGVASTVVLVRLLSDNKLQNTPAGHIALSWLICEDFIAVFALLLLPALANFQEGMPFILKDFLMLIFMVCIKFGIWVAVLFTLGRKVISFILHKIHASGVNELFTLATLAITFSCTVGSAALTGTSIALGAFVAGMMLGQTTMRQQISANLMPLRDAFVVFFFLSIGMLFNPAAVTQNLAMFLTILAIILLVKPLAAWVIVRMCKLSNEVSITIALALAQIGEFSFILSEEAVKLKILPDEGYDIIVACAFVSLAINPLLLKTFLQRRKEIPSH
jgi:CPA2 family monovalent cation:H+ antiporter-2